LFIDGEAFPQIWIGANLDQQSKDLSRFWEC
jgi:hypothetical protein